MNLGKKLYQSSAMPSIKAMAVIIGVVLFLNLYFQTFNDPSFIRAGLYSFKDVINFHIFYPEGFIIYVLTILLPAIYYGFLRGVRFYEKGIIINKGLPFFNMVVPFESISKFEVINQKHFMSITRKDTEDDYMFSVNQIDRVLAILDQNHISGDLGGSARGDHSAHKKLILFFLVIGIFISLLQYSGFIRQFFR
jgi:hypothetical protein